MQAMYEAKCVDLSAVKRWLLQFDQQDCSKPVASRKIDISTDGIQKLVFFSPTQRPKRLWVQKKTSKSVL